MKSSLLGEIKVGTEVLHFWRIYMVMGQNPDTLGSLK
jgi:hypothetical protein